MTSDVLITAAQLRERIGDDELVILDVRWALGDPDGRLRYLEGHIPGAAFVDLDSELAAPPSAARGRHPLPDVARLEAAARRWGIRQGSDVVAYDNGGNMAAARAWWLLRWAGSASVRLLDGGLAAWTAAGGRIATDDVCPVVGDVSLGSGRLPVLDADGAASVAATGVLLDARAGERYRGEVEPVDPRAGHIPGARSAPTGQNLTADGTFRSAAQLRQRFEALGARDGDGDGATVGAYCGSGVTAAHQIAALTIAGFDAGLYAGSWSQWSRDPSRPAAAGPSPDGR